MLLKQFVICDIYIYFRLLGICEKKKCNCSIVVDDDDDFKSTFHTVQWYYLVLVL